MLNVGIVSLGCPKNLVDSENVIGNLKEFDVNIVNQPEKADIIIVNTCGFIESAKQEAIDTILEMSQFKESGKYRELIVIGCLAERYKDEIYKELPEVDKVYGLKEYDKLVSDIVSKDIKYTYDYRTLSTPNYMAYLKISDGCDNKCTYCAIPMIRGKHISRPKEEIIAEAKKLVNDGVKEIVLVAQDTTRYGIDLYDSYELHNLLKELCKIEGLRWIRILYAYPELVTDELIEVMKNEDKICKYLDIPLQHINDDLLRRMNRRARKTDIYNMIDRLKTAMPNIALRTSIITGFPGETEENIEELIEFIKYVKFDNLGVFAYSREEDTPAADFDDQIEEKIKEKRRDRVLKVQQKICIEKNKSFVGSKLEVIIDEKVEDNLYLGRCYKDTIDIDGLVYVNSEKELNIGEFYDVKITSSTEYDLYGEVE